jgi:hypothetical protein
MMTLTEIQAAQINPLVAREAYIQVSARLTDTLETKKSFDQKAFALFSGFLTIALALFGVSGALFKDQNTRHLMVPFLLAGVLFVAGTICFILALKDKKYGALASSPDMWLMPGIIDGADEALPLMLAYVTYFHDERISTSTVANERKAKLISAGIYCGVVAPIVLFGAFFLPSPWLQPLLH